MKLILYLSGENLELAKEEAIAIADADDYKQDRKILVLETKNNLQRLAFTKQIFKHLFSCKAKDLEKKIKTFDWQKIYKKNFCVRTKGRNKFGEKQLASWVWEKLEKPKVNLKKPATNIYFLFDGKNVHSGLLIHENKENFKGRRPHLREGFHPTSIQPKLARALINLSRIKKGQTLLDPFCGTGGILIEAGLIGCKLKGNDIDKKMLKMAEVNLKSFRLKPELTQGDALKLNAKADAIVTDLPYGRGSFHNMDLDDMYKQFLEKAYSMLKINKYLVAVFPKKIKIKTKLKIIKKIEFYVHNSLTRHIIIAKKQA